MTDEPYIKRELESPTPKRQRLSSAQDMFDLMQEYSPPPPQPQQPQQPQNHSSPNNSYRRRPQNYSRWERHQHHGQPPRSPAGARRSPYPPNNHLRRSPHHGHGLRRSNRHRQHHQDSHHRDEVIRNFPLLDPLLRGLYRLRSVDLDICFAFCESIFVVIIPVVTFDISIAKNCTSHNM